MLRVSPIHIRAHINMSSHHVCAIIVLGRLHPRHSREKSDCIHFGFDFSAYTARTHAHGGQNGNNADACVCARGSQSARDGEKIKSDPSVLQCDLGHRTTAGARARSLSSIPKRFFPPATFPCSLRGWNIGVCARARSQFRCLNAVSIYFHLRSFGAIALCHGIAFSFMWWPRLGVVCWMFGSLARSLARSRSLAVCDKSVCRQK